MGVGLGAENVVGYATMTEFVPPQARGKWLGIISVFVVAGLPVTALLGTLIIPRFGWRIMFVLGGLGALVVWHLRKALPESPRWLESVGRTQEADAILRAIEEEVSLHHAPLKPPAISSPAIQSRGLRVLLSPAAASAHDRRGDDVDRGQHIDLWVHHLAADFLCPGRTQHRLVAGLFAGHVSGCTDRVRDWRVDRGFVGAQADDSGRLSSDHRDWQNLPVCQRSQDLLVVGFLLTIPIYVLVTLLFAIYIPELFPTEVRMRASGICNTFGRGATILTPFIVVALFRSYQIGGVLALMIALLIVQIVVVLIFGVEPKKRRLEEIDPKDRPLPSPPRCDPANRWRSSRELQLLASSAAFTRAGVKGICRRRAPVASKMALPIAAATTVIAVSPAPDSFDIGAIDQDAVDDGHFDPETQAVISTPVDRSDLAIIPRHLFAESTTHTLQYATLDLIAHSGRV